MSQSTGGIFLVNIYLFCENRRQQRRPDRFRSRKLRSNHTSICPPRTATCRLMSITTWRTKIQRNYSKLLFPIVHQVANAILLANSEIKQTHFWRNHNLKTTFSLSIFSHWNSFHMFAKNTSGCITFKDISFKNSLRLFFFTFSCTKNWRKNEKKMYKCINLDKSPVALHDKKSGKSKKCFAWLQHSSRF